MNNTCYYCKYTLDNNKYCHKCNCFTMNILEYSETTSHVILKNDAGYTQQYTVKYNSVTDKTTITDSKLNLFISLSGQVFTPENIKRKLSLYILLS